MPNNFTIANACNVPLSLRQGTIPNVQSGILDWMQLMTFTRVVKTVVGFQVVETPTDVQFWGLIQPLSERSLLLKPEGQRAWTWFELYAQSAPNDSLITLNVDEVVTWNGKQTRIMGRKDYALYGYCVYSLVQDWIQSGPPTP